MKKTFKLLIALVIVVVLVIGLSIFYVKSNLSAMNTNNEIIFTISNNDGAKNVFNNLQQENIIKNADVAYYYSRLFNKPSFKAGDFNISSNQSVDELIKYLSNGNNIIQDTVSITFPEGDWLKDYANKISEVTNITSDELLNYWNDQDVIRSLMNNYPFLTEEIFNSESRFYLEGYLFPNTYEFYRETTVEEVTKRFLDETLAIYNKYLEAIKASDLTIHEIFTLASIVQYEASKVEDMQMIAGVFLNRLAINMPLQSSVTVCYAMDIDKENDSWTTCEYNPDFDSPYNTYMYYGLTPGPILNPGEEAIKAVLNPTDSDYLFFMADVCGDGKVYYAEDYDTHLEYIAKYLTCY